MITRRDILTALPGFAAVSPLEINTQAEDAFFQATPGDSINWCMLYVAIWERDLAQESLDLAVGSWAKVKKQVDEVSRAAAKVRAALSKLTLSTHEEIVKVGVALAINPEIEGHLPESESIRKWNGQLSDEITSFYESNFQQLSSDFIDLVKGSGSV